MPLAIEIRIRKSNEMVNGFVGSTGHVVAEIKKTRARTVDRESLIIDIAISIPCFAIGDWCRAWEWCWAWGIIILLFQPAYEVIIQPRQHNSIVSTKRRNTLDSAASQIAIISGRQSTVQQNQLANPLKCTPRISIDTLTAARMWPARSGIAFLSGFWPPAGGWYVHFKKFQKMSGFMVKNRVEHNNNM